jgi:hypothetical protein
VQNDKPGRAFFGGAGAGGGTMKFWFLVLVASACTGCTMLSLERHTLSQSGSVIDLRYREVVDNLALVANNPWALPCYSSIFTGTAQVTDSGELGSKTVLAHMVSASQVVNGFSSEEVSSNLTRAVLQNWTLDPIVVPEKLEAIRCCCRWVLFGPEAACTNCPGLLASPDQAPGPGRHFDVADKLARLPKGWLHVGTWKEVPKGACYKSHCADTWVWVMPDGMQGLADFTLVLQDIARVNSNSPTLFNLPALPSALRFKASSKEKDTVVTATVALDQDGHLVPPEPFYKERIDNVGSPAGLRSQINAAGGGRR